MSQVLVSGYIGFDNCGDEAILMALMADLAATAPGISFTVLSRKPAETAARYGIRSINRFDLPQIFRALAQADLVISGGGSLLQDATSSRSLYYYLLIIWLAKQLGKPVVLYANGIGPIRRQRNRRLAARILDRVELITLRESLSAEEVRQLGVTRPVIEVTADPAFTLCPASSEHAQAVLERVGLGGSRPLVGVSVRQWPNAATWGPALAAAADHVCEVYGAKVVFLPMQFPGDVAVSEAIRSQMRQPAAVVTEQLIATDYLALVGQLDILIGMRLHALIFAAHQHVPLIGLAYDPKVVGFLRSIGQPSAGDPALLTAAQLISLADQVFAERTARRDDLAAREPALVSLAHRNAQLTASVLSERVNRRHQ